MGIDIERIKDCFLTLHHFSGVVVLEQNGKEIFCKSSGCANLSQRLPNTPGTRFGLASIGKAFTAVAVCQLIDRGLLTFDTLALPLLAFDFPHFDPGITIQHLLTHTSGIPDYFDEEVMDDYAELWTDIPMYKMRDIKDFIPMFQNGMMRFKPGEKSYYCNSAFLLLGLVVEKLSGMRFIDYVQKNILEPCSMKNSGYFALDNLPERVATGYIYNGDSVRSNIYAIPVVGGPDGGIFSTAYDLFRFWDGLNSFKLMSPETTKHFFTPFVPAFDDIYFGCAVWIKKLASDRVFYSFVGSDPGYDAVTTYCPQENLKIAILGNSNDRGVFQLHECISKGCGC